MFSGSYVGATQMLAAIGHPPHLAGICPVVTASNYHENWTYQGGAFEQWFNESWTCGLAQDTLNRSHQGGTNALLGRQGAAAEPVPGLQHQGPDGAELTAKLAPYFLDWLAHPTYDDYWKQWSIEENYPKIQVPALTIAAWYDIFQGGSLRNYLGIAPTLATRRRATSRSWLSPSAATPAGAARSATSISAPTAPFDENAMTLDWYDYLFKGKQNEFANGKPVKIFVMGENKWRDEETWPLERAKETRYYLHSDGKANGARATACFRPTRAGQAETADTLRLRPGQSRSHRRRPACAATPSILPPARGTRRKWRPGRMCWSIPRRRSMRIPRYGPVTLDLFAKSSAVDTDFTGKLVDVAPDGKAINLTEGILRARYRESTERRQAHRARQGVRVQDRSVVDEQRVPQGPQNSP